METLKNLGLVFEESARKASHAFKSDNRSYDYQNASGTVKTECKRPRNDKAENYKERHAVVNSAHGHEWARNENGEIDYLLSCEKFAKESTRIKFSASSDHDDKGEFITSYAKRYAFYFCRIQWQTKDNCRLCVNPLSTRGSAKGRTLAGRRLQLETLELNGVKNVPSFEECAEMYHKYFD